MSMRGRRTIAEPEAGGGRIMGLFRTRAKAMTAAQTGALWRVASARMPTKWGKFDVIGFERDVSRGSQRIETALAMVM